MDLNQMLLVLAAILPALGLCIYIYKKDRVEKEPIGLLLFLLILGVLSCYPAARIERELGRLIESVFIPFGTPTETGVALGSGMYSLYLVVDNFIGIALVEEGVKFLILFLVTVKNKNFNSLFDGIIYSVFVSLGFAGFENILYVIDYGWRNALSRAVTAVPGHTFFAIIMGYCYSMWMMYKRAGVLEQQFKETGWITPNAKPISGKRYLVYALLFPVLGHGLYDYCCSENEAWASWVFYGLLLFLYIYCFGKVHKMSVADEMVSKYAGGIVLDKYPRAAFSVAENDRVNQLVDLEGHQQEQAEPEEITME